MKIYSYTLIQFYTCYSSHVALSPASLAAKIYKVKNFSKSFITIYRKFQSEDALGPSLDGNPLYLGIAAVSYVEMSNVKQLALCINII